MNMDRVDPKSSRTRRLLGSLTAILAAFVLCLLPLYGDGSGSHGGEGGVVVLPGGRSVSGEGGPEGRGEGQDPPRMDIRIANMSLGLTLRMPENMPHALAFLVVDDLPLEPLAISDGLFHISGPDLEHCSAMGVGMLEYLFTSTTGMALWVQIRFEKAGELRLLVY